MRLLGQKSTKRHKKEYKALKSATSNIDEVIRLVLNILGFFQDKISHVQKE